MGVWQSSLADSQFFDAGRGRIRLGVSRAAEAGTLLARDHGTSRPPIRRGCPPSQCRNEGASGRALAERYEHVIGETLENGFVLPPFAAEWRKILQLRRAPFRESPDLP